MSGWRTAKYVFFKVECICLYVVSELHFHPNFLLENIYRYKERKKKTSVSKEMKKRAIYNIKKRWLLNPMEMKLKLAVSSVCIFLFWWSEKEIIIVIFIKNKKMKQNKIINFTKIISLSINQFILSEHLNKQWQSISVYT